MGRLSKAKIKSTNTNDIIACPKVVTAALPPLAFRDGGSSCLTSSILAISAIYPLGGLFGSSSGRLGAVLAALWAVLAALERLLGRSWRLLGGLGGTRNSIGTSRKRR